MTYLQHRALGRPDNRWPAQVRRAVFDSAVADGALINALRVEPALGSPSRGGLPDTIARRDGDGWRLSGHKLYSTGIPALRWLPCGRAPTNRSRVSACSSSGAILTWTTHGSA